MRSEFEDLFQQLFWQMFKSYLRHILHKDTNLLQDQYIQNLLYLPVRRYSKKAVAFAGQAILQTIIFKKTHFLLRETRSICPV